jgi:hypothetical protein
MCMCILQASHVCADGATRFQASCVLQLAHSGAE